MSDSAVSEKGELRKRMRQERRDHVAAQPDAIRELLFLRPPVPIAAMVPEGATVGLYHALGSEAPADRYARWFLEHGRRIALPWFADRTAPMAFRAWSDPFGGSDLVEGPFGLRQPASDAVIESPDVLIIPLLAFTACCDRLGQGAGHYDRWIAAHPGVITIGLAWDCQLVGQLPLEPHDRPLDAVVTPTRIYERPA